MDRQAILDKLAQAWSAFKESFAGLPEARLTEPGVTGDWSVKDIVAHVTTWEEEALQDVLRQLDAIHRRLVDFVRRVDEAQFGSDTRFRRRLRLDTYSHYPQHAAAIREWRAPRS